MALKTAFFVNEPKFSGQLTTLLVGAAGALLFRLADVPGGVMSGSMAAVALFSVPGWATSIGTILRLTALIFSGVSIGSAVTPETLRGIATYPLSLVMMSISALAVTGASTLYLMRFYGWNKATSLLSSTPGGFSSALSIAAVTNADIPRIVIVQMFRVSFLMVILPIVVSGAGVHLATPGIHAVDSYSVIALILIPGIAFGHFLDRRKLAGGMFLGVMLVSGTIHGLGIAPGRPPDIMMFFSQMMIGSWIGSRFVGFQWKTLGSMMGAAIGSIVVTLVVATIFAELTSLLLGISFGSVMVAFAPGAFEAMTMLAFSLGLDPLYAVAHHLGRLLLMTIAMPVLVKAWLKDSMLPTKTRSFK